MVAKDHNLLNNRICMCLKQFVQRLTLLDRQMFFVREQHIAILPELGMQRFAYLVLVFLGLDRLQCFSIRGQRFIQMPMHILYHMEKVILDHRSRIDRLNRSRIGQPKINIKDGDPQAEYPKPAQDRLNMPGITLLEPDRKKQPSMFVTNDQFPAFRASGLIFVEVQRRNQFFLLSC
jgi:hypothetical protein